MPRPALAPALALVLALAPAGPAAAHPFARARPNLTLQQGPQGQPPLPAWSPPSTSPATPTLAAPTSPPPADPATTSPAATSPSDPAKPASPAPGSDAAAASAAPDPSTLSSQPSSALPPHPLRVRPEIDVPVIALGMALWFGTDLAGRDLRWAGCAACDRGAVRGIDHAVLGNSNPTAAHVSDALLYTAIGAPFVADLADALVTGRRAPGGARHAAAGWARDAVVLIEVLAVNVGLTNLVKFAVRRPRPYSYEPDSPLGDVHDNEARLSFYSGHASTSFAMATAWATIVTLRHPRARAAVPAWIAALGLGTATGVLRVVAGKHFWTDVLTGAVAGAAVGVLVPLLHRARPDRRLAAGLRPSPTGATLSLSGAF